MACQHFLRLLAQDAGFVEPDFEGLHGRLRGAEQASDPLVTLASFFDFVQAMAQGFHQRLAPLTVGQQVVFEVGIAPHYPDVAQHFVKHARGTSGDTLAAQFRQCRPRFGAEQSNDNLAIGEGGVVVGDFAQAGCHAGCTVEQRGSIVGDGA